MLCKMKFKVLANNFIGFQTSTNVKCLTIYVSMENVKISLACSVVSVTRATHWMYQVATAQVGKGKVY